MEDRAEMDGCNDTCGDPAFPVSEIELTSPWNPEDPPLPLRAEELAAQRSRIGVVDIIKSWGERRLIRHVSARTSFADELVEVHHARRGWMRHGVSDDRIEGA